MKFLVDMPLSPGLSKWLVQQGHDAVHAYDVDLAEASDIALLDYALRENRMILTADLDYPRLLSILKTESPGLVLFRGGDYSEQESIDYMRQVFKMIPAGEMSRSIIVVEKNRIRRRHLPLS